MPFIGTIVDFVVVLVCGLIGSLLKRGIPERFSQAIMSGLAICVVYIGVDGVLEAAPPVRDGAFLSAGLVKAMVMIISIAIGTLIGELIDIEKWVGRLGDFLEKKLSRGGTGMGNFSKGFVACSILFCVGAMAVNGAMQDALGKPDIMFAKSIIDGITCVVMAASFGIGCAFSAFFVLAYQGALSLLSVFLVNVLPASSITYMSVTGSLIIILVGTNVLGATKVRTANMIPAIFLPALVGPIFQMFV